jgi:hypothetical protein
MALIADEAIANLTAVIESTLGSDGREILIVMAGDNGGMPGAVRTTYLLRTAYCVCARCLCLCCVLHRPHTSSLLLAIPHRVASDVHRPAIMPPSAATRLSFSKAVSATTR